MALWTADSIDITADGICWTADGYNGCVTPPTGGGGGGYVGRSAWKPPYDHTKADRDYKNSIIAKIQADDEEVIAAVIAMFTKGIF